jgi:hypothetical protein
MLIRHWATLLSNVGAGGGSNEGMVRHATALGNRHCNGIENGDADFVIILHILMHLD